MARKLKTVTVFDLVEKANKFLQVHNQVGDRGRHSRRAVASFLEGILHDTNNYRGFRYLSADEMENGLPCGIVFDHSEARKHVYPDDTRVAYYPPPR